MNIFTAVRYCCILHGRVCVMGHQMFLILALFTVTPNVEGTFRLGKNPTSLSLIQDHCVESFFFFFFLISTLKEHMSLHVYK